MEQRGLHWAAAFCVVLPAGAGGTFAADEA